jgi:hypothetical protein
MRVLVVELQDVLEFLEKGDAVGAKVLLLWDEREIGEIEALLRSKTIDVTAATTAITAISPAIVRQRGRVSLEVSERGKECKR